MSRICALLLLAIIGHAFAQPSPAAPAPHPAVKLVDEASQSANDRAKNSDNLQSTSSAVVPALNPVSDSKEANEPQGAQDRCKEGFSCDWWTMLWTGLGVAGALAAAYFAFKQLRHLREQLVNAHPPYIRVNNFAIWVHSDDGSREPPLQLTPGIKLRGHVFAINTGANDATIESPNFCCVQLLTKRNLPMIRPFDPVSRLPNSSGLLAPTRPGALDVWWLHPEFSADYLDTRREFFVRAKVLRPGEFAFWPVQYTIPENADPTAELYLMGQVNYLTPANTHRATFFCRRYNPALQRFERVGAEYTDYEGEE